MKKIKLLFLCGAVAAVVSSCNFLDIVPDDTATIDDAFANELTAEAFLYTCYSYQPLRSNFLRSLDKMTSDEIVMSPQWNTEWFPAQVLRWGLNNSTNPFPVNSARNYSTDLWQDMYTGIRQCYMFLENIDGVTPTNTDQATFDRNKEIWKGEAWCLIGYFHQLLFQHYGPIVVVEQKIENEQLPRLPIDQVVEKINTFYDNALETLPNLDQSGNYYGRITREVAMALKAKTYLFGASPLFNGSEAPYSLLENRDGTKLIPTFSKERWKAAMDATKAAIDVAKQNGHALYTQTTDPIATRSGVEFIDPGKRNNYLALRYLMMARNNIETIWGYTGDVESVNRGDFQEHSTLHNINGRSASSTYPSSGLSASLQVVKLFYTKNGKPVESDPDRGYPWTEDGRMTVPAGGHSANLHLNREPRFYAAIGYSGGAYEFNETVEYKIDLKRGTGTDTQGYQGSATGTIGEDVLSSGYAIKKHVHPEGTMSTSSYNMRVYPYTAIRLADLYLMYAEACAEYNGSLDATALGYLAEIHNRAGLDGGNIYYAGYTGDRLIEAVRRERMIELVFEGHWYYDLRRWLMADKWHNDGMWGSAGQGEKDGMWGLNVRGATDSEFFVETPLDTAHGMSTTQAYIFRQDCDYLYPIRIGHLTINEQLVQNPGY